jgi:hypothetical protein
MRPIVLNHINEKEIIIEEKTGPRRTSYQKKMRTRKKMQLYTKSKESTVYQKNLPKANAYSRNWYPKKERNN